MLWLIVFVCTVFKIIHHFNQSALPSSSSVNILSSQSIWRYREDEQDHQIFEPTLLLPARSTNPALGKQIEIPLPNPHGSGVKLYVKAMVQNHPLYNCPITTDPPIDGWTYKGEPIPIDTLALWVFGSTGYEGNVRFLPDEGRIRIQIPLESPDEVEILLRSFYRQEQNLEASTPVKLEESFSIGSSGKGSENALKTEVKSWVRNRQVEKLR